MADAIGNAQQPTLSPLHAKFSWGYVRVLEQREEMPQLRDHLMRLDRQSRHDRFNGFLDDDFVARYAERCAADGTVIVAYVENGTMRGCAELHPPEGSGSLPEIAFSVEASTRRLGVGSMLFARLLSEARRRGWRELRITTGPQNQAMRALAAKFGARLSFRDGESTGTVEVDAAPSSSRFADLAAAPFVAAGAGLALSQALFRAATAFWAPAAADAQRIVPAPR